MGLQAAGRFPSSPLGHTKCPCHRFYELTGHYPDHITVVSYTLKQNRFSTLHRGALRFPPDRFKFVGTQVSKGGPKASIREAPASAQLGQCLSAAPDCPCGQSHMDAYLNACLPPRMPAGATGSQGG